jgi:hypothetical protein
MKGPSRRWLSRPKKQAKKAAHDGARRMVDCVTITLCDYDSLREAAHTRANAPLAMRRMTVRRVRFGSFTTNAFSTRADQCPLLLQ